MTPSEKALRQIESEWNAAAATWDVEALSNIYAEEAVLFGGLPGLSSGKKAIRAYFSTYSDTLKSVRMKMVDQDFLEAGHDIYIAQGFVDFTFHLASGNTISTKMRTTWVIIQRQGMPKLLAHHFSNNPSAPPTAE